MKKFLLLAGAALCMANSAEAMMWSKDFVPYIGGEYVYSHAKQGKLAKNLKNDFHSGKADVGLEMFKNYALEFSFQMSGELKNKKAYEGKKVENSFAAYAMDLYGKYPIMCSDFSVVGTTGLAIYHAEYKGLPSKRFSKVGYRVGGGMQYDMTEHFALRTIGRYSYIGADRLNHFAEITVGMLMKF